MIVITRVVLYIIIYLSLEGSKMIALWLLIRLHTEGYSTL